MFFPAIAILPLVAGLPSLAPRQMADKPNPDSYGAFPVIAYGNGCPGNMTSRYDSVVDYMYGFRTEESAGDIWGVSINLPSTMRPKIGPGVDASENKKECTHYWRWTNSPGFALNIHKNGTWTQARYKLDKGVTMNWRTTYFVPSANYNYTFEASPPDSNALRVIKDSASLVGPADTDAEDPKTTQYGLIKGTTETPGQVQLSCGESTFGIHSEIWLEADSKDAAGEVLAAYTGDPYDRFFSQFTFDFAQCSVTQ